MGHALERGEGWGEKFNKSQAAGVRQAADEMTAARGKTSLLELAGGVGGVVSKGLMVLNIYFAYEAYKEGAKNSTGEGVLNALGSLQGLPETGTMLRQAAELGFVVSDPAKLGGAIKSGASPVSVWMGVMFGSFR
jgi:hypothetical protein